MDISVIICTHNPRLDYLRRVLDALKSQTFQGWECIIVNDGSPDNTAFVAREWTKKDSRFRYIEKLNGGLSSARNAGIKSAVGEFVHFLDADDFMLPEAYAAFLGGFQRRPEAAVAYCGCRLVNKDGGVG